MLVSISVGFVDFSWQSCTVPFVVFYKWASKGEQQQRKEIFLGRSLYMGFKKKNNLCFGKYDQVVFILQANQAITEN